MKINTEDYTKNSNKRLDDVVQNYCLRCSKIKSANDQISNRSSLYFTVLKIKDNNSKKNGNKKINLKEDENKYVSNCDHVLCNNCLDDYSRILLNNNQTNKKGKSEMTGSNLENCINLGCSICECEHSVDARMWQNLLKKKACCGVCDIF